MSTIPSRRIECRDDVRGDNLLIVFIFVVIVIAIILMSKYRLIILVLVFLAKLAIAHLSTFIFNTQ